METITATADTRTPTNFHERLYTHEERWERLTQEQREQINGTALGLSVEGLRGIAAAFAYAIISCNCEMCQALNAYRRGDFIETAARILEPYITRVAAERNQAVFPPHPASPVWQSTQQKLPQELVDKMAWANL